MVKFKKKKLKNLHQKDCSIVPLQKFKDLYQVSTTDFFFPLVDDPYIMV